MATFLKGEIFVSATVKWKISVFQFSCYFAVSHVLQKLKTAKYFPSLSICLFKLILNTDQRSLQIVILLLNMKRLHNQGHVPERSTVTQWRFGNIYQNVGLMA